MRGASPYLLYVLVFTSGMVALSWEVIWQIKSTLALGVSAWGTAITLAVTIGGMSAGSLIMGRVLRDKVIEHPMCIYGALECMIGVSAFVLLYIFKFVGPLDSWIYAVSPDFSWGVYAVSMIAALGVPTMCMGATLPIIGLMSRQFKTSIAVLYGMNTMGAAIGVLLAAFLFIPAVGVMYTVYAIAFSNIVIGLIAIICGRIKEVSQKSMPEQQNVPLHLRLSMPMAFLVVFVTGFATFMLEVSWFRSLRATFMSTTDAFAIMLSCVLLALGLGAWVAPALKRKKNISLGLVLAWAGILILLATPLIERFDLLVPRWGPNLFLLFFSWFRLTLFVIGPPIFLLGIVLPSVLDDQKDPGKWAKLYALNTFAAIIGSLVAAWVFLPHFGFARTAWAAGALVVVTGIFVASKRERILLGLLGILALCVAVTFEFGIGRTRIQGATYVSGHLGGVQPDKILKSYEGPDATVSAVEYKDGGRVLFIDGFIATQQPTSENKKMLDHVHYMAWMGHMPMLLHLDPENALVICMGTGQTANAVRKENPDALDIVDINKNVFKLAEYFPSNENVLDDPRVHQIIADGRAHIRRTDKVYDVITLEPMPPNFAGVNALYSKEFYALARTKMADDGVIAQWLPFHLLSPYFSASISKTFQSVFPNAILWVDPIANVGILLGSADDKDIMARNWAGLNRDINRDLSDSDVRNALILNQEELLEYSSEGELITDDNQRLSYGKAAYVLRSPHGRASYEDVESIKQR